MSYDKASQQKTYTYGNNRNSSQSSEAGYDFSIFRKNKYRDDKGNIRENLILQDAPRIAEALSDQSSAQVKQFFGEVKAQQNRSENGNFASTYPFILMLKSKAAYKLNRGNIKGNFKGFIDNNVDIIIELNKAGKGKEAFDDFVMFFETMLGFFNGKK